MFTPIHLHSRTLQQQTTYLVYPLNVAILMALPFLLLQNFSHTNSKYFASKHAFYYCNFPHINSKYFGPKNMGAVLKE